MRSQQCSAQMYIFDLSQMLHIKWFLKLFVIRYSLCIVEQQSIAQDSSADCIDALEFAIIVLTFSVVVSVAMFKALLRMGVAAGAKAAAEPMRREAIASFMLTVYLRVGKWAGWAVEIKIYRCHGTTSSTDVQGGGWKVWVANNVACIFTASANTLQEKKVNTVWGRLIDFAAQVIASELICSWGRKKNSIWFHYLKYLNLDCTLMWPKQWSKTDLEAAVDDELGLEM